jgi:acetolactate synthase regulatory subunit
MSTVKTTAMQHPDTLLEIEVRPGDAALLRVISTLHQRQAHVRTLAYDDSNDHPRLSVRVASQTGSRAFLVGALQRCVDVLSVHVPTSEAGRGRRGAGGSADGGRPAAVASIATSAAERVWA